MPGLALRRRPPREGVKGRKTYNYDAIGMHFFSSELEELEAGPEAVTEKLTSLVHKLRKQGNLVSTSFHHSTARTPCSMLSTSPAEKYACS